MLPAILLIDDDPTANFLHHRLLTRLGLAQEVLVAGHGEEALALLRARHQAGPPNVALILLDLNMPVMNGFGFLDAYQQLPAAQRAGTVVVMLTTSQLDTDQVRARQLPITGFLNKPLTAENLRAVLPPPFGWPPSAA